MPEPMTTSPSHASSEPGLHSAEQEPKGVSVGDRIQFTAPRQELHVANRSMGTIEQIAPDGSINARMDSGRTVLFDPLVTRHFDHGYAVTSHSAQGLTADRVLVHVDQAAHPDLVNSRFGYVAVSRARFEAGIFTDDASRLPARLSAEIDKSTAIDFSQTAGKTPFEQSLQPSIGMGL